VRVVFFGASGFGLRCLKKIGELSGLAVCGVVTAEKQFAISYNPNGVTNLLHADFHEYAEQNAIPCHLFDRDAPLAKLIKKISAWNPDIIVVVGWYHMIPAAIRTMAPVLGLHASLLPRYRGGAPLVWAIINGETQTGITLFRLSDGVDDGDILG